MSEPLPYFSRNHLYGCLGREKELEEVITAWQEPDVRKRKRIYIIHGAKECGKSCAARMILDEVLKMNCKTAGHICIDMDFKLEGIRPDEKEKFYKTMAMKMKEVDMTVEYGTSEKSGIMEPLKRNKDKKIIFLFDNIDQVRDSELDDESCKAVSEEKDIFSDLCSKVIPAIVEINDCNIVVITSTVQIHFGKKRRMVLEIKLQHLETEIAEELLLRATEDAREEIIWGPFRHLIARLCEGSPGALITTASELVANNCFIEPVDMVINLLLRKIDVLSPELYPDEDNIRKTYLDFFGMLSGVMKTRMIDLSQMEKSRFSLHELKQFLDKGGKAEASGAIFKMTEVNPMLDRCLLRYDRKSEKLEMPDLFKEVLQVTEGQKTDDRLECVQAIDKRLKEIGIQLGVEEFEKAIKSPQRIDEIVHQMIHGTQLESEEEVPEDLKKDNSKKKFSGYSEDSILHPRQDTCSSVECQLPKQDVDKDCDDSSKRGTTHGKMQVEQPQNCLVPGQLYEHVLRADFNAKHPDWPMSMTHSPQSMAHAGLVYQGDNCFRCQYCQRLFSRSELDGNLDPMEKHKESSPDCLFVQINKNKCLQSPCQVTGKEDGPVGEIVKGKFSEGKTSREDSPPVVDRTGQVEQDFLQQGFQEKDVDKAPGAQRNTEKIENKLNLSSSFEEKRYPLNKMDSVMMEGEECQHPGDQSGVGQVVNHTDIKCPGDSNSMEEETNLSLVAGNANPNILNQTDQRVSEVNNLNGVDLSMTEKKTSFSLEEGDLPPKSSLFLQLL